MTKDVFTAADGSERVRAEEGLAILFLRRSWRDKNKPPWHFTWYGQPCAHNYRQQVRKDIAALREIRTWNAGL